MTSMIALKLCWPIFAVWYMLWGSTQLPVSTQITDVKFEIEKGTRYECGVIDSRSARSMLECSAVCAQDETCYGFNFGSGQCELLSATASDRITAPGWTHGYYPTGKCQIRHQENPIRLKVGLTTLYIWVPRKHLLSDAMHC